MLYVAGLAELDPTQPVPERVLREGGARRQEAWQGELLVPRPRQLQHVRQRLLPTSTQAVQEEGRPPGGWSEYYEIFKNRQVGP